MAQVALTTTDNPHDPFEDFISWFLYDVEKGYDTCAYLDRVTNTSDALTDEENEDELERAIDEIVLKFNPITNDGKLLYKKVVKKG